MWPVKISMYPKHKIANLIDGWGTFVRENFVKGGEVCSFELINREDSLLRVHIIRKYAEWMVLLLVFHFAGYLQHFSYDGDSCFCYVVNFLCRLLTWFSCGSFRVVMLKESFMFEVLNSEFILVSMN